MSPRTVSSRLGLSAEAESVPLMRGTAAPVASAVRNSRRSTGTSLSYCLDLRAIQRRLVRKARLFAACNRILRKEGKHGPVERRQVAGVTARNPVAILNNFAIQPIAAGVANVVLHGVIACQGSP